MTKIGRPGMSEASKAELWRRWKNGDSLREIGRALEKEAASIRCVLAPHGGIMPRERHRSLVALSMIEREGISRGLSSGRSVRGIAASISRSPSTVSREIIRHGGRNLYRQSIAARMLAGVAEAEAVSKLQSWNLHVFMRASGAAGSVRGNNPAPMSATAVGGRAAGHTHRSRG